MKRDFDVLVVEDEPVVVDSARKVLASEGLRLDAAGSVPEAVERLGATDFRVVLVDLMLPEVSGFELVRTVAAERPDMPVVVITGYATPRKATAAFGRGAFDFLPKPFDVEELLTVVRRALRFAARAGSGDGLEARRERFGRRRAPAAGREGAYFFLGSHAWARPEADGTVVVGPAETFPGVLGTAVRIEARPTHGEVVQGGELTRLVCADGAVHRVWSPVGGHVVEVNAESERLVEWIDDDPFGRGWLARLAPSDLERELEELVRR